MKRGSSFGFENTYAAELEGLIATLTHVASHVEDAVAAAEGDEKR